MIINKVKISDFQVIHRLEKEFPEGIIRIRGRNGSGKSSLLDAIAWCLFGNKSNILRGSKMDVIRRNQLEAVVEVTFTLDDTLYIMTRKANADGTGTGYLVKKKGQSFQELGSSSDAFEKYFNISHHLLYNSLFVKQREVGLFQAMSNQPRKDHMFKVMGISALDNVLSSCRQELRVHRKVKDEMSTTQTDYRNVQPLMSELLSALSGADQHQEELDDLHQQNRELGNQLKEMDSVDLDAHNRTSQSLLRLQTRLDEKEKDISEKEKRIAEERSKVEDWVEIPHLRSSASETRRKLAELNRKLDADKAALSRIKDMMQGKCPTCQQTVSRKHADTLLESHGGMGQLEGSISLADGSIQELNQQLSEFQKQLNVEEEKKFIVRRITEFEEAHSRLQSEYQEIEKKLESLKKERESLPSSDSIHEFRNRKEDLLRQRDKINSRLRILQQEVARNENIISNNKRELDSVVTKQELENEIYFWTVSVDVVRTFKDHMLQKIYPTFARSMSEIVKEVSDGKYSKIVIDEDFGIKVEYKLDGKTTLQSIRLFSGGEQNLFNLAFRLSLAQQVSEFGNFIVLDEIFESLDRQYRSNLSTLIHSLKGMFKQSFIVTHVDDIQFDSDLDLDMDLLSQ